MLSVTFCFSESNPALRLELMIPSTSGIVPSAARALRNFTAGNNIHFLLSTFSVFESVNVVLRCDYSNESFGAVRSCHVSVVLFIVLHKVVLTFESVDEILRCGH